MALATRSLTMAHDADPKKEIMGRLKNLSGFKVVLNNILIAVYERPEKTASGIILTERSRQEDRFQGKVGLVVGLGPLAFKDDKDNKFEGQTVEIGQWICIKPSDGWALLIGEQLCRMIVDTQVRGILDSPDIIY
jgi:co-chaperonin GroES (HSP10)